MLFTNCDPSSGNHHQYLLDGSAPDSGPPHSVLTIINAEEDSRSIDEIFHELGWEHYRCRIWQDAVILLRKHRVSAILVDIGFSVVVGRRILDTARQPGYSPKLILAYRFSERQDPGKSVNGGVFHWIWKPFRKDEVRGALGFALMQCQREWERYLREGQSAARVSKKSSGSEEYREMR